MVTKSTIKNLLVIYHPEATYRMETKGYLNRFDKFFTVLLSSENMRKLKNSSTDSKITSYITELRIEKIGAQESQIDEDYTITVDPSEYNDHYMLYYDDVIRDCWQHFHRLHENKSNVPFRATTINLRQPIPVSIADADSSFDDFLYKFSELKFIRDDGNIVAPYSLDLFLLLLKGERDFEATYDLAVYLPHDAKDSTSQNCNTTNSQSSPVHPKRLFSSDGKSTGNAFTNNVNGAPALPGGTNANYDESASRTSATTKPPRVERFF